MGAMFAKFTADVLTELGSKGLEKFKEFLDEDNDGEVEEDEIENLFIYMEMLVSIWAHSAKADGIVQEDEEEAVDNLINIIFFDTDPNDPDEAPLLPKELLQSLGLKKKELKKQCLDIFNSPHSIKKISSYAIERELEDLFYSQAIQILITDKILKKTEREFLDDLAESFEISKLDKKRIERELFEGVTIE